MAEQDEGRRAGTDVRVSNRDRDRVVDRLGGHFAEGRITADELAERLDAAHVARTGADLARLEQDLPTPPATHAVRRRPGHAALAPPLRLLLPVVVLLTVLVVATGGFPWPLFLLFAAGPLRPCSGRRSQPRQGMVTGR